MELSATIKNALQEALKTGPERSKTRALAVRAALVENRELITKAMAQGYSATALAKKLKASGITASVETLRQSVLEIARVKPQKRVARVRESSSAAKTPVVQKPTASKAFDAEDRTA